MMAQQATEVSESQHPVGSLRASDRPFLVAKVQLHTDDKEEELIAMIDDVTGIGQMSREHLAKADQAAKARHLEGTRPTRESMDAFVQAAEKLQAKMAPLGITEDQILAEIPEARQTKVNELVGTIGRMTR